MYVLEEILQWRNLQIESARLDSLFSPKERQQQVTQLTRQLSLWEDRAERLLLAYERGILDIDQFQSASKRLANEKREWQDKLHHLKQHLDSLPTSGELLEQLDTQLLELPSCWLKERESSVQVLVRQTIYQVRVYRGQEVEITFTL